jgi:hypothetical protein
MFDLHFESFDVMKTYVKWEKIIQMVAKYDNKTLMPLLMVTFKFLNFNSSGPIKPTPIVHNDDSIFGFVFIHLCCSSIFFIHAYVSSTIIVHPCTHGKIFLHIMIYFMQCVKEYSSNILLMSIKYSKQYLIMFTYSRSCSHIHHLTSPFIFWGGISLLWIKFMC